MKAGWVLTGVGLLTFVCGYCASFAFWMTAHPDGETWLRAWQVRFYSWGAAFLLLLALETFLAIRFLRRRGKPPGSRSL
jgi:hypothetical protein